MECIQGRSEKRRGERMINKRRNKKRLSCNSPTIAKMQRDIHRWVKTFFFRCCRTYDEIKRIKHTYIHGDEMYVRENERRRK